MSQVDVIFYFFYDVIAEAILSPAVMIFVLLRFIVGPIFFNAIWSSSNISSISPIYELISTISSAKRRWSRYFPLIFMPFLYHASVTSSVIYIIDVALFYVFFNRYLYHDNSLNNARVNTLALFKASKIALSFTGSNALIVNESKL